jgi:hypothetical protein
MPDARLLDHRLLELLSGIETTDEQMPQRGDDAETRQLDETRVLDEFRRDILSRFHGNRLKYFLREYAGIGLAGSQCGTTHRSLNDGTDFGYGSASPALWQVAYGTDAPRYLRALGVPMNISRFAVSALAYADKNCVSQLLSLEKQRFYGKDKVKDEVIDEEASTPECASYTANNNVASAGDTLESTSSGVTAADDSSEVKGKTNEKASCSVSKSPQELLDPSLLVPAVFRNDSKLRAGICLAVLLSGFPAPSSGLNHVSSDILELTGHEQDTPIPIFDEARFREVVMSYCGDLPLPNSLSISEYIESSLLPHCLRLCLYGNGPATREARGSQGEYETALGVSLHLAPSQDSPCPLPDPCVVLQDHSLEALGTANAILRRTRLLRTCQYLCSSGKTTAAEITEASRSKLMNSVNTMPVWWCPWVHDVALLVRAATNGLLSLLHHRTDDSVFSINAVGNFLRSTLENQSVALARHTSSPELLEEWIRLEAGKFPTLLQIERRLAFLCCKATAEAPDPGDRFVVLPMFDHGGWPRD